MYTSHPAGDPLDIDEVHLPFPEGPATVLISTIMETGLRPLYGMAVGRNSIIPLSLEHCGIRDLESRAPFSCQINGSHGQGSLATSRPNGGDAQTEDQAQGIRVSINWGSFWACLQGSTAVYLGIESEFAVS